VAASLTIVTSPVDSMTTCGPKPTSPSSAAGSITELKAAAPNAFRGTKKVRLTLPSTSLAPTPEMGGQFTLIDSSQSPPSFTRTL